MNWYQAIVFAVGARSGKVRFTASRGPMNLAVTLPSGVGVSTSEATVEVAVTTVDQLISDIHAPLLWKVDVEGYEPEVLSGAVSSLRNPGLKAVLLEADTPTLQGTMSHAGFSRYIYDPFSRQLHPLSTTPTAGSGHNQLWIRDLSFVQEGCRTAACVRVGRTAL